MRNTKLWCQYDFKKGKSYWHILLQTCIEMWLKSSFVSKILLIKEIDIIYIHYTVFIFVFQ